MQRLKGSLDIMVQRTGGGGAAREVVFIKNNYFHDAFFLKALGESRSLTKLVRVIDEDLQCSMALARFGVSPRRERIDIEYVFLPPGAERYTHASQSYGVSYSGASYKFTVLDPTGARKATQG